MNRIANIVRLLSFLVLCATAPAQTITDALANLRNHINGTAPLTAAQIKAQETIIHQNRQSLGSNAAVIADALELVTTYETVKGPLFTTWPTRGGFKRDEPSYELPQAMFTLEQLIIDWTYSANSLALHENLLDGWKIRSSSYFPGSVAPPADSAATRTVPINASQPAVWGAPVLYHDFDARRPTGSYLAPGSIGVVTVPAALVGKGFKVRVGAHSWDLRDKDTIKRHDRVSRVFPISATVTRIANPLGGGIYIEVPYLADEGIVPVQITNAVRSPFFSATSHNQTTLADWQNIERKHSGPWADFESDKFMMQVPRSWIYNYANPVALMADWDKAMDAVSDLFGLPLVRSKTVMYAQTDVILRVGVNAPGYPMSNDNYNPYANTNGNQGHYLLTGPKFSRWEILHELGHAHYFTKFTGEIESAVNLLHVAVHNMKFGVTFDQALGRSIGNESNKGIGLKHAALSWILTNRFRAGQGMREVDMKYQHRGHGKYVEIARMFGWEALGEFWKSVHVDYMNGIDYPENSDPTDSRILRMSKAAGADLRPLIHLWGIRPVNHAALANAIAAAGLQPSGLIYDRLKFYQSSVPMTLSQFRSHYWAIKPSMPDEDKDWYESMFDNYTPAVGQASVAEVQQIINLYFPFGDPTAVDHTWDVQPGNNTIDAGNGTWATTASANWTTDNGTTHSNWTGGANAVFGYGDYTVDLGSGITANDLTLLPGGGSVTIRAITDGESLSVVNGAVWNLNDNTLNLFADGTNDTKLAMAAGGTLTVTGFGTLHTGEKPVGADWLVENCTLDIQGSATLRGTGAGVGKFKTVKVAGDSSFFHEPNVSATYANAWELDGQVTFDNRFNRWYRLDGAISGTGGITIGNLGVLSGTPQYLRIDHTANTYTGRTVILAGGTLRVPGGFEASLGSNPPEFTPDQLELDGGTFQQTFTPELVLDDSNRGITLGPAGGTFNATGILTLNVPVSGPGPLTVSGGTIRLDHESNGYTGDTSVTAGTLRLSAPHLANTAAVKLATGALLELAFDGVDSVRQLVIDGVSQPAGTWGSPTSAATFKSPLISGTGILNVVENLYATWAQLAGLDGTPGKEAGFHDDADGDGLINGFEWILVGNPLGGPETSTRLSAGAEASSLTFKRADASEELVTLCFQWSNSLAGWQNVVIGAETPEPDESGVGISITENGPEPDDITITLTRDPGASRVFLRLAADIEP